MLARPYGMFKFKKTKAVLSTTIGFPVSLASQQRKTDLESPAIGDTGGMPAELIYGMSRSAFPGNPTVVSSKGSNSSSESAGL
jgi:hypothetical protein